MQSAISLNHSCRLGFADQALSTLARPVCSCRLVLYAGELRWGRQSTRADGRY
jgi:hypothetical protein